MPTAIVRIFTGEGFVIGADGLETAEPGDAFVSDSLQKIFHVPGKDKQLAHAVCGIHRITSDKDGEILWDLHAQVQTTARALANARSATLYEYATRLSRPIHRALLMAGRSGKLAEYPALPVVPYRYGSTIAEILIDGYYRGFPSRAGIRFFHDKQKLCGPQISPKSVEELDLCGSRPIWNAFCDVNDKSLAAYRPPCFHSPPWSLVESAEAIRGYIQACSSPEGKEIDDEAHKVIGGHIHIATITPVEGFRWVPGYEPDAR